MLSRTADCETGRCQQQVNACLVESDDNQSVSAVAKLRQQVAGISMACVRDCHFVEVYPDSGGAHGKTHWGNWTGVC